MDAPSTDRRRRRWAVAVFALVVLSELAYVAVTNDPPTGPPLADPVNLARSEVFGSTATAALGLVLCWLRPRNAVGWLLSLSGGLLILCDLGQAYGAVALADPSRGWPLGALALSLSAPLWIGTVFIPVSVLLVRYPTGVVSGRWGRRFDRACWTGLALVYVSYATSSNAVTDSVTGHQPPVHLPAPVAAALGFPGAALMLGGTVCVVLHALVRARRSEPRERAALLLLLGTGVVASVLIFAGPVDALGSATYLSVLAAVAVGVLRYNALGIEIVVRRALLYVMLTGLVLVAFVGVTALLAELVPTGHTPQVLAAALIAVGLLPARDRLQRLVDRVIYGSREDPAATLRRLGSSMGATPSEGLLVAVTANLTEALRVDGAEVVAVDGTVVASWGEPGPSVALPLTFAGEDLGELRVGTRHGEALGRADRALLDTVAPLIAAVVHAVSLADDLRTERNRVVAATETERSRLRQELHDGLGPSLTGIGLGLEAAQSTPAAADPRAADLLARLRQEVQAALEETRRIIDDLRPGSLEGTDLVSALQRRVDAAVATGLDVRLDAPTRRPVLAPDVEAAAFRVAEEALTNVVRHARARRCLVTLRVDGELRLVVEDDGVGLGESSPTPRSGGGVGLWSMRERAHRLDGTLEVVDAAPGTRVSLVLPLLAARPRTSA